MAAVNQLVDISASYSEGGTRSYTLGIRAKAGTAGTNQWLKYRAAIQDTDERQYERDPDDGFSRPAVVEHQVRLSHCESAVRGADADDDGGDGHHLDHRVERRERQLGRRSGGHGAGGLLEHVGQSDDGGQQDDGRDRDGRVHQRA